jgi:hypothetical protein
LDGAQPPKPPERDGDTFDLKNRDKMWKMIGVDLAKQERCRRTIIKTGLRHEND